MEKEISEGMFEFVGKSCDECGEKHGSISKFGRVILTTNQRKTLCQHCAKGFLERLLSMPVSQKTRKRDSLKKHGIRQ